PSLFQVVIFEDVALLDVRQNEYRKVVAASIAEDRLIINRLHGAGADPTGRETAELVQVAMEAQTELLHVVEALRPLGSLANLLHRRQKQSNQNRNDGDHDQQFDERERPATETVTLDHDAPRNGW